MNICLMFVKTAKCEKHLCLAGLLILSGPLSESGGGPLTSYDYTNLSFIFISPYNEVQRCHFELYILVQI